MSSSKSYKIVIAETAPIIRLGLINCIKNLKDIHVSIFETDTQDALFDTVASEVVDLIFANPTFGGLLHPNEIRKYSRNEGIKIFAIEISKLSKTTLSLYDDHMHVTDDASEIRNKIVSAVIPDNELMDEKETLSSREKEIISYVVKGFTNQEIADKLFLSVHTVMTHRRNIARKLQIHSATGLTIYAIVNKIVDLSDIKL